MEHKEEEGGVVLREGKGADQGELFAAWARLRLYCFNPSPSPTSPPPGVSSTAAVPLPWRDVHMAILFDECGREVAGSSLIPMTQNVRNNIASVGGIRGVTTYPEHRRRGHIRTLMQALLQQVISSAMPIAILYPFKTSFYQRMGYAMVGARRKVTFSPALLPPYINSSSSSAKLPRVERLTILEVKPEDYTAILDRMQRKTHGLCRFPLALEQHFDFYQKEPRCYSVGLVRDKKGPAGLMTYNITGHKGEMIVEYFAYATTKAKLALLAYIGLHMDQVKTVSITLSPAETFEHWMPDYNCTSAITVTVLSPQMAKIVCVPALEGFKLPHLSNEHEPLAFSFKLIDTNGPWQHNRKYSFKVIHGILQVKELDSEYECECNLDVRALTSLFYGTLSPSEIALRDWGNPSKTTRITLEKIFPQSTPYYYEVF